MKLDLSASASDLTEALVDISSVSGTEEKLADKVEKALSAYPHLKVFRHGNTVVARTDIGRAERVVLAGHLDTVPLNDNLPARRADGLIHGLGACDMKGGVAVALRLAATVDAPNRDVTYVFYDCEEIEAERNGLFKLTRSNPELLEGVFAVVMEPSNAVVEAGCQGTMRIEVSTRGERAHSARSWMGSNAIHAAGEVLARLSAYEPRRVPIDGLEYREGLSAVAITGGVAGNVVPDRARSRSTTGSRRTGPRRRPRNTCARCSRGTTWSSRTPRRADSRGSSGRPRPRSCRWWAASRSRSSGGRTWRGSRCSAYRR